MPTKGFQKVVVALLVALTFASCGLTEAPATDSKGKVAKGKGKGGGPVPVLVTTAVLKDVPIEIQVVGNVEAYASVSIRAQVGGQLTNVYLRDGDFVKKGDVLFSIDPRQIDGQLAQAEANMARSTAQQAQAEANLARDSAQESYTRGLAERYEQLVKDGIFSSDQGRQTKANAEVQAQALAADRAAIQSAKAQISADQAAINNIRLQKTYTSVVAPVDGRTGNVTQKLGNIVTANNTELAVVHQVQPIYVSFAVPEARLNEIKGYFDRGGKLPVVATAQDGSGMSERGELTFIDNSVDTSTGTIKLKGTFPNTNRNLWPGQFVNATLLLTTRHNAVVVPNQAVQTGQDGTFLYVVGDDQKVQFRPVKVGPRVDTNMVIESGLEAGEVVVTEGQLRLQPGSTVQVGGGGGRGEGKGRSGKSDGSKGKSDEEPAREGSGVKGGGGGPKQSDAPDGAKSPEGFKGKGGGKGKRTRPDGGA